MSKVQPDNLAEIEDPLVDRKLTAGQKASRIVGTGIAAVIAQLVAGFLLITLAPRCQPEHLPQPKETIVEVAILDDFEETIIEEIPEEVQEDVSEPETDLEPEPEPEPEAEPEPVPDPIPPPDPDPEPDPEPTAPDDRADPPAQDLPDDAYDPAAPIDLDGLTEESFADSGDFTMKAGQGIKEGRISQKYIDPNRKIRTAEGGTGQGYERPVQTTQPRPRNCPARDARITHRVEGEYPTEARRRQLEATVTALVTVGTDGRVRDVEIVQGAGFGFDESAAAAFRQFRFEPAQRDCEPIESKVRLRHIFDLDDF